MCAVALIPPYGTDRMVMLVSMERGFPLQLTLSASIRILECGKGRIDRGRSGPSLTSIGSE
jgi:hypothetical protein